MINKELLLKVARTLKRIRHERHYQQGDWAAKTECGTAACVAGYAVMKAGYKILFPDPTFRGNSPTSTTCINAAGEKADIREKAMEVLGLNDEQAEVLFSGSPMHSWPVEFANRWRESFSTKERRSRIAADLLLKVVETDGKILKVRSW